MKGKIFKRVTSLLSAAAMLLTYADFSAIDFSVHAENGDEPPQLADFDLNGNGKIDDGEEKWGYELDSADDLYWFADKVNNENATYGNANAFLAEDITVNENLLTDLITVDEDGTATVKDQKTVREWTPIGTCDYVNSPYSGTFDGNNKTISGLYFNESNKEYVGLFGKTKGTIKNVTVADSYFCGRYYVGGVCGDNYGTIEYITVTDSYIHGSDSVGGVCGFNSEGTITNCYNTGDIIATDDNAYVGGVCGRNTDGSISNCYNTGAVEGTRSVGGVCGSNTGGSISDCYNTGTVEGTKIVSGVCGYNEEGIITNCYNTGAVEGTRSVGGVCGYNYGTITNCYNTGDVSGTGNFVGGVCGYNEGTITNCYYLADTDDGNGGKTASQFASGEVCWLLNGGENQVETPAFFQTLGKDELPVLDSTHHVVKHSETSYYNEHSYENGICTVCEDYEPATDSDGDGCYEISNAGQLYWFAGLVNGTLGDVEQIKSANAVLADDITVNENLSELITVSDDGKATVKDGKTVREWTPIGCYNEIEDEYYLYSGTFDGNNKTISGLYFNNDSQSFVGLFGYVQFGKVQNVTVADSYFCGSNNVGGVCGCNYGTIEKCYNVGNTITATDNNAWVGGVCGINLCGTIEKCYNAGSTITATGESAYVGGVCGWSSANATSIKPEIVSCYNTDDVTATGNNANVGGVCGRNDGIITDCYNRGDVSGSGENVGGVSGYGSSKSTITNCYFLNVEGLVGIGENKGSADIKAMKEEKFASGEVCWLLNGGDKQSATPAFYQNIGNDDSPVLDSNHHTVKYDEENNKYYNEHTDFDENGFCTVCGNYEPATDSDGNGVYEISNAGQLYWFADKVDNDNDNFGEANAVLTKNITVNSGVLDEDGELNSDTSNFRPWINHGSQGYQGTFDGAGYTISGLYFNKSDATYVGLFGLNFGTIENVTVTDSYFCGSGRVGGICGNNKGTIEKCSNTGKVVGCYYAGGICGENATNGAITNCYNTGDVTATSEYAYVGGVCGYNNSTITNCYNTGDVTATGEYAYVGGICGYNKGTIENCSNTGSVNGKYYVGGVSGYNIGTISNCYNTGDVIATSEYAYVGGVGGRNYEGTIKNCYNTGKVTATGEYAYVGGVCGANDSTISDCYNTGTVEGTSSVGGVCGSNFGTLSNCYYLADTDDENGGKTASQFASGEVCWLLNGGETQAETPVFYQNIGTDAFPVLDSTHNTVYRTSPCVSYSNTTENKEHSLDSFTKVEATCTTNGHEAYWYCKDCGKYFSDEACADTDVIADIDAWKAGNGKIAATGHTITPTEEKKATCTEDGCKAYWYCSVCKKYFSDEACADTDVIADINAWKTGDGKIAATGHIITKMSKVEASCTTDGCEAFWFCIGCGKYFSDEACTDTDVIADINAWQTGEGRIPAAHKFDENGFCTVCDGYMPATDSDGDDYYEISNAGQLYWFADKVNNEDTSINAVLTDDITVNNNVLINGELNSDTSNFIEWILIGNFSSKYSGTFDGAGYTISGLYFNESDKEYVGLFGIIKGTIKNVTVADSYFYGSKYVGGVCGYNTGTIEKCSNTGTVNGKYYVGGICGDNHQGEITNCYNTDTVTGDDYVGGICGDSESTISNCYNTGDVTATSKYAYVGGVCGDNYGTISNCYNTGTVNGKYYVGGVCGKNYGTISNCYYLADTDDGNGGKTASQFASGEVCWLLNGGETQAETPVFYQTIGEDAFPVLDSNHGRVYMTTNCVTYSNTSGNKNHLLVSDKKDATCTEDGYSEYWYCKDCGKCFSDEACADTDVIADINAWKTGGGRIPAGHKYGDDGVCTVCHKDRYEKGECGDNASYKLDTETGILTISGTGAIWESAFYGNAKIKEVVIENGITIIGSGAFLGCTSLTDVTIPASVTSIDDQAFQNCKNLKIVTFEENSKLESIGIATFFDCTSLTNITIPDSVTSIGSYAFYDCTSLTNITIPDSVTSIGESAFYGCTSLTSISAPCTVKLSEDTWRNGCNAEVTYIHLTENVDSCDRCRYITGKCGVNASYELETETGILTISGTGAIWDNTFYGNAKIKKVVIENGITIIGSSAFNSCASLTDVTIPASVTSIEYAAFFGCTSLTSITIPASVKSIGITAFQNCSNLKIVTFEENSKLESIGNVAFLGCASLTSITIPDSVKSIGANAFLNCTSLTSISAPCTVKFIEDIWRVGCNAEVTYRHLTENVDSCDRCRYITGECGDNAAYKLEIETDILTISGTGAIWDRAFYGNTQIKEVVIGDGITEIGFSAFAGCTSLTSVTFGENSKLESISNFAFEECESLRIVEIPASVTSIGQGVFDGTKWINTVAKENNGLVIVNGILIDGKSCSGKVVIPDEVTSIVGSAFYECTSITSVTFGENSKLESIGSHAFYSCEALESIEIPASVTSIGPNAFRYTKWIKSVAEENNGLVIVNGILIDGKSCSGEVVIPDEVTSIVGSAFAACTSITSITFGENSKLESIDKYAFQSCGFLKSITIPDSVTSIGEHAFDYCEALESVTFGKNSNLEIIGDYAFECCYALESITIPASVTSIGDSAFYSCKALESVTFGENSNLEIIGDYAFEWCKSLKSITIPDSVTSIGNCAFEGCYALESISIPASVTSIGNSAFYFCTSLTSITIPDSVTSIGNSAFNFCTSLTSITAPCTLKDNASIADAVSEYGTVVTWNHDFESGICENCGALEDGIGARLAGHTLTLDGSIGVNFYMELDKSVAEDENAYMHFTFPNGKTEDVNVSQAEKKNVNGMEYYVFKCNVAATEMTDTIKAQIKTRSGNGIEYSYTVKEYADYLLAHTADNKAYEDAEELVRAMLNYGAYAQKFKEYNTDSLPCVPSDVSEYVINEHGYTASAGAKVEFAGANLSMLSNITLRLFFKADDITDVKFMNGAKELEIGKNNELYFVEIANITPDELSNDFTVSISDGGLVTYSPMTYCYQVSQTSNDAALVNLVKAIAMYNDAAKAYFKEAKE